VVGFDDIAVGSLYEPTLTTVYQPMRMLGERACARLLDRIADPGLSPAVELLPTELVLRSSCGYHGEAVIRQPVLPLRADRDGAAPAKRPARRAARTPAKA
jgi:LacI family transcriptional regulator